MENSFVFFHSELEKYSYGIHILNDGLSEYEINIFKKKFSLDLPISYCKWLQLYNGGELFATPVGTTILGILGDNKRQKGMMYLEDNFKSYQDDFCFPNQFFIIAYTCDGDYIGFDLKRSNSKNGVVVYWNHETGEYEEQWDDFVDWLNEEMISGKMLVNYDGSESDYFKKLMS